MIQYNKVRGKLVTSFFPAPHNPRVTYHLLVGPGLWTWGTPAMKKEKAYGGRAGHGVRVASFALTCHPSPSYIHTSSPRAVRNWAPAAPDRGGP